MQQIRERNGDFGERTERAVEREDVPEGQVPVSRGRCGRAGECTLIQVKTYHRHFSDLLSKSQKVKSLNKSPGGTEKTISPPKPPQFTAPLLPDPKQPPVKQEEPDGAPPLAFSPEPPQLRYSSGV